MSFRFGVIMDPIAGIKVKKDTSFAFMLTAQRKGWEVYYLRQEDLFLEGGIVYATCSRIEVRDDPKDWYTLLDAKTLPLHELDMVIMRKDPPVDAAFVTTTHLLDLAEARGLLVANRPASLRDCNEKLFATHFPELCPPLRVSSDPAKLADFHAQHRDVIFKPLDGMGGRSIFRVQDDAQNLNVILETLTENGTRCIMAQTYLPEIRQGDKRILMVFGEPVPFALARIPTGREHRGNLAAGGTGEGRPLTARDREICARIGPELMRRGLYFVGLDVIGDHLTEINVTSPTCLRELESQFGVAIADDFLDKLARLRGTSAA
ncbi:MAG: glutathione synthase [Hahellaceae bacterium]|jgi:glutathione synthase|nr:glutathione synthase [Hahellaceae bacterium]